ncbi:CoA-acylating methylmalonate-semialdehyde dehydrogenase [Candidatus Pelagibacter sp.]|jgi:malonate-semialdehyde dehydrogenase (acetylating)/methylmalonate-semialdehyde dehydrogenase|nr:CoA-acylating methylmalonate-semialdehyde dehydrogenase [Candidatus Pelagibacter sp.]MDA9691119.1 CoA-acylating methylmalonate-semialdehyde dehydrogenase [Candidatus Pelagibacter sp.]MDA9721084.1 CoA-acylating methylmalonate-semialdehyde dehydrogenase [Candidatus Pelagibacter sp.]OCW75602.1 methylmalonate-semialdehyde dehydrogenase [Pelagibacteraceae bacterium GOM-A2]OCW76657.1 methylmalonate-semialdehyde dehydrogenase [Pelagibacteraceae bacterium GOM-A1]|tara:strand:- start:425 stop:1918 length:1494 start_codon:yes stop_codon:yes gene_type:complete
MNLIEHFIDGKIVSGTSDRKGKVFNPAIGKQESEVRLGTKQDLDLAVQKAKKAFETWSNVTPIQRARIIFKYKEIIEKNSDLLAKMIVSEHGKVYEDAKGSLTRGLEVVEFACGIPQMLKGDFTENVGTNIDSWSVRQPLGVCAGITPFNFPAMVPMWMFPMAIACGNTFVLKPSEKDPSCPLKLAELFSEAGLPDGVLNVVNGDKEVVDAILEHKDISAVSFVGSTPIAKYIYENAAKNEKRVQALGGAKNHCVVMPDCDLDQAVNGLMGAAYGSAGERCMAQSVAVAVGNVGDKLVDELSKKVEALKIGPGMDKNSEMGPLVTKEHLERVRGYVDLGIKEGADLVVDGRDIKLQGYEDGYYIGGCLFDNVKKDMRIYKEEIFGPVLSVVRAKDFNEALNLINDHEFGNGTSIYTRDGDAGRTFANQIKVGMVGINIPIPVPVAFHSFGGWKRSLFGDQHMHGPEGVRFYTKLKTITSRWPSGVRSDPEFIMPTMK